VHFAERNGSELSNFYRLKFSDTCKDGRKQIWGDIIKQHALAVIFKFSLLAFSFKSSPNWKSRSCVVSPNSLLSIAVKGKKQPD
jgi:hypothetical protein